jgi:hypothetical protein
MHVRSRAVRLRPGGVSGLQEQLLAALRENPCADVNFLAAACAITRQAVHRWLSRLNARGVVEHGGGRGRWRVTREEDEDEADIDDVLWLEDALTEPNEDPARPWIKPVGVYLRFDASPFAVRRFG